MTTRFVIARDTPHGRFYLVERQDGNDTYIAWSHQLYQATRFDANQAASECRYYGDRKPVMIASDAAAQIFDNPDAA